MSFKVARLRGQSTRPARELPLAAAQAFEVGALLLINASGQFAECGADPAAIAAVAESPAGTDTSGFIRTGKREFPPGYVQGTLIQDDTVFRARYTGSLPAADGGSYGVVRDTDGFWKVDFSDTTATRVKLVQRLTDSPLNVPEVLVTFLAANIQAYGG